MLAASQKRIEIDAAKVDAGTVVLPYHLQNEARRLLVGASYDNPISEPRARPLVQSTAIWLMRQGVINRSDHPGVIAAAGEQLHDIIGLHLLQKAGKTAATTFAHRINLFLANHVRNETGSFMLEVPKEEQLDTPMRPWKQLT